MLKVLHFFNNRNLSKIMPNIGYVLYNLHNQIQVMMAIRIINFIQSFISVYKHSVYRCTVTLVFIVCDVITIITYAIFPDENTRNTSYFWLNLTYILAF